MARKQRNLASFGEVANTNINNNKNNDININVNINNDESIDESVKEPDNYLDKLIEGNTRKKSNETVLTGIYLQKDIAQVLDRLAKKGGRGAKSKIVNEALKNIFEEKGLL